MEGSPEPSTILWENLAYDKWVSGRRRVLTSIIALLMILISLALIFSAKYLDQVKFLFYSLYIFVFWRPVSLLVFKKMD